MHTQCVRKRDRGRITSVLNNTTLEDTENTAAISVTWEMLQIDIMT